MHCQTMLYTDTTFLINLFLEVESDDKLRQSPDKSLQVLMTL